MSDHAAAGPATASLDADRLTHLQWLEAEAIQIMREAVAEADNPAMLYSVGKDSSVMLHLAVKAFYPSTPPFPLVHVDTMWKFQEMYTFRDATAERLGMELVVHHNPDCIARDINPFDHGSALHTDLWKTEGLKQLLDDKKYDLCFGGARRDEEKSRAKERVFSIRSPQHQWDPKRQRPELWQLYNGRRSPGESIRVFPLSNWTELDLWQYIHLENIPLVSLYFAEHRPVVQRDGSLIVIDDDRFRFEPGEEPVDRLVRFRTLGCYPITGAIESDAASLPEIIRELFLATTSERQNRVADHDGISSLEKKKQEGALLMADSTNTDAPNTATPKSATPKSDVPEDVQAYLDANQNKSLLRFITCGSVDDGKSTLIGRLLYESHLVFEDHLAALEADSAKVGTQGGDLDFALLLDGLSAEREQGITIDVSYRFFTTDKRKFIVADTPGHEQYTRNMVTGASTADVAILLVDARKGVLTQTRRHSFLVSLLGIKQVVIAINKMDLVDYADDVFDQIRADYLDFAGRIGLGTTPDSSITFIPLSALKGDNVTEPSTNTPWYHGPTLMGFLETVEVDDERSTQPFRMPVQWVNRPNLDFRGFSGQVVGGTVRPGDAVRVLPSGTTSTVDRIVTMDGDLDRAIAGQSVTITLADEVDASRGDVLCGQNDPAEVADQFEAHVVWMHEDAMLAGRPYLMKIGTRTVGLTISNPKYRIDVNSLEHLAADTLELNEIGVCNLSLDRPIPFDPYPGLAIGERNAGQPGNRDTGGFIIIDKITQNTVGAGLLHFALRRSHNIHWQDVEVNRDARVARQGHRPGVVWFTGLSGAGKSTIANVVEQKLHAQGVRTYLLDGDNVRHGLNRDLGFTDADRVENIRRIAEVAALMVDAGIVVLVSFISPFRAERRLARERVGDGEFIEVHVDASVELAASRDPKGLYAKARRGELKNFTGIDSPYEAPESPEVHVDTATVAPEAAADSIIDSLRSAGIVD